MPNLEYPDGKVQIPFAISHQAMQTLIREYTEDCCAVCFRAHVTHGICEECLQEEIEVRGNDNA